MYNNLKQEGRAGNGTDLWKVVTDGSWVKKNSITKTWQKEASAVPSVKYENVTDFVMMH